MIVFIKIISQNYKINNFYAHDIIFLLLLNSKILYISLIRSLFLMNYLKANPIQIKKKTSKLILIPSSNKFIELYRK